MMELHAPCKCRKERTYGRDLFIREQDYSLDKSSLSWDDLLMESNPHFFFGLADAADARIVRRMSFLMLASNFRVGTCFNSFFRPSSNGSLL